MFKKEGQEFLPKYENFLKHTGRGMAQDVAKETLGVDLENKQFWIDSIMGHELVLSQFEELVKKIIKNN